MARFFPDGVRDMALNNANQDGGLNTPPQQEFDTPAMQGSLQQALSENLGQYVVVEFLIGTQTMEQKSGILYAVGTSVLTLFEEESRTFVICDIFSVKFVTFYLPGHRPQRYPGPYGGGSYPGGQVYVPGPVSPGPAGGVTLSGIPGMGGGYGMGGM